MPSLLCLHTDIVKTHPPGACLGQSHVPKAHISCSFTPVTAMFKLLVVLSLSCSGPDPVLGQTLIHFLPGVWVQTCILLASPRVSCRSPAHSSVRPVPVLFRICSIYLPWKKWEQRSIWKQCLRQPWSLARDSFPQCRGLGPCCSEMLASFLD